MDYSLLAILLLMVALALVIAEIFIPSGGLIMVVAIAALVASVWCAWKEWWYGSPTLWWSYVAGLIVLLPAAVGAAFYILPRTSFGRRILLEGPSSEEVTPHMKEQSRLMQLIGRTAKTLTLLNPGGLVSVDGERLHCESEGMLIDPDEIVEIVGVEGNRLVVRLHSGPLESDPSSQPELDDAGEPPLDFTLPQS